MLFLKTTNGQPNRPSPECNPVEHVIHSFKAAYRRLAFQAGPSNDVELAMREAAAKVPPCQHTFDSLHKEVHDGWKRALEERAT